ncbi:aldolase [Granulicella sp. 5B5]|nr:aldolase [Granulicella sp. 5B5]
MTHAAAGIAEKPQKALLYDMDLPLRRTFYPLGYAVDIVTNDPRVLRAGQESFGHRRLRRGMTPIEVRIGVTPDGSSKCPPEPARREYNHLYSLVADHANQAMIDLKTLTSFAWLNEAAFRRPLYVRYNFLEKIVYLLLGASVVTDIHAACVSKRGKGILLCGDSGAGKSTLAYGCARAGWTYTSDDTSYLINDAETPQVIGHAHRMRFRPETRSLLPELSRFEVTPRMEGKPSIEVSVTTLPVQRTSAEAAITAIVYLQRRPDTRAHLSPLPLRTATERMQNELFSAGEIRAKHMQILETLANVPTYELQYTDLNDGIEALETLALDI